MVEVTGVDPVSEEFLPELSTSLVDVLTFPYCNTRQQVLQLSSSYCVTKFGAKLCSHLPLIDAPYTVVVLCTGTSSIKLLKQLYCCQLILKLQILKWFCTTARLLRFKFPVEAFTPPCIIIFSFKTTIIQYFLKKVKLFL